MTVTVNWLLEHKVIHVIAVGDVAVADITNLSETVLELFSQSDAPLIHVLISEEKMGSFPKSLQSLTEVAKFLRDDQLGWFIIYGNTERDRMAIFMGSLLAGIAKVRHRRFETLKESLEFLTMVDSTLPSVNEMLD